MSQNFISWKQKYKNHFHVENQQNFKSSNLIQVSYLTPKLGWKFFILFNYM